MSGKQISPNHFALELPANRLSPHSLFFLFYNFLYFLPVLGIVLFDYSEGGASAAANLDATLTKRLTWIYLFGVLAFLLGSKVNQLLGSGSPSKREPKVLQLFSLGPTFYALIFWTIAAFALSKVLIAPLGVYSDYAFDTENMSSSIWTFSMFCSESLLFLSLIILFSNARRNVQWFLLLTAVNGLNLLHGTRIFFMIAGIAFCFYLYSHAKVSFKLGLLALACFSAALGVGYLVFLSRSHIETDDQTFTLARVVSPIMFESVFSQLSLFEAVRHPELWNLWGSGHHFFLDALYLTIPRFLYPQKDQALFINRFTDLSPLGAFSGYAQGLIYFGVFFPIFYFTLGFTANWLLRHARNSQFWSAMYVYFTCDFMFRTMRDGYIIPVKMLVDALAILGCVVCFSYIRIPRKLILASQRSLQAPVQSSGDGV